jgi:SIR2-like domain
VRPTASHYGVVADLLADGVVIPFLGAGANLCDRPSETPWEQGRFPPSGGELAAVLAKRSHYPEPDDQDLLRISQYVHAMLGETRLYEFLHSVFDADYPPSSLHRLLARLPALLRERGSPQLVVLTTNYDDLVERAFIEANERFDVVWYVAKDGPLQGRFLHRTPEGDVVHIERPNKYTGLALGERPAVLKLHGAIDRGKRSEEKDDEYGDSYVVTENSYIDYLSGPDVGEQIPLALRERMADSHFLFLGYSMRDWNLRVILNRIWGAQQNLDLKSWAIQREPESETEREIEERLWRDRVGDVELLYDELKDYVERIDAELSLAVSQ